MKPIKSFLFALGLLALPSLVACGGSDEPSGPTFADVSEKVVNIASCGGPQCHSGPVAVALAGFALTGDDYATLVDQPATGPMCADMGLTRVVPGDPDSSLLYLKLLPTPPCGESMPQGQPTLPQEKVDLVRTWIEDGAPQE